MKVEGFALMGALLLQGCPEQCIGCDVSDGLPQTVDQPETGPATDAGPDADAAD